MLHYFSDYIVQFGWGMFWCQVGITCLGVPAIFISQSLIHDTRRWGSVFGLIGQPFWFTMAYLTNAWGVFFMCLFYTYAWGTGFFNHWVTYKPNQFTAFDTVKALAKELSDEQLRELRLLCETELLKRDSKCILSTTLKQNDY